MKAYHLAWLQSHPERSREWLKKMLAEGFEVHHIDLDHTNDHPANLALIDAVDHMRLHGLFGLVKPNHREAVRKQARARWAAKPPEERVKHARMMATVRWKRHRKLRKVMATETPARPVRQSPEVQPSTAAAGVPSPPR